MFLGRRVVRSELTAVLRRRFGFPAGNVEAEKGEHKNSVRDCPGRVSMLQTPGMACFVKGELQVF